MSDAPASMASLMASRSDLDPWPPGQFPTSTKSPSLTQYARFCWGLPLARSTWGCPGSKERTCERLFRNANTI